MENTDNRLTTVQHFFSSYMLICEIHFFYFLNVIFFCYVFYNSAKRKIGGASQDRINGESGQNRVDESSPSKQLVCHPRQHHSSCKYLNTKYTLTEPKDEVFRD